jgi:pimeloyl-ACP methyl ester carboxylesterase
MSDWSEGFISAIDLNIHYHRTGGADKPPLILLHGVMDNGLCWTPVARDLQDSFDVIMPDARGHGLTSGSLENFSYPQLGGDVAALISALGLEKPVLFGHSMGATTSIVVASTYPELVRAIVLEDPPFTAPATQKSEGTLPRSEVLQAFQGILSLRTMSSEERLVAARKINPTWNEVELRPWADSKVEFDTDIFQHLHASFPWREKLQAITCPFLLVTGDPTAGAILTPEMAQEVVSRWQYGEMIHIPGAGHCIHRDRYAETMPQIQDFLSRV